MHRATAQAIWYRHLDRNCFTSTDASTEQQPAAPAKRGRWFPRFGAVTASKEWRPLAEERRRLAVELSGDSAY